MESEKKLEKTSGDTKITSKIKKKYQQGISVFY